MAAGSRNDTRYVPSAAVKTRGDSSAFPRSAVSLRMDATPAGRHSGVALVVLACVVGIFLQPPMPGPVNYNRLADERSWLGVPNTLNVLSNLPFAVVGLLGLTTALTNDSSAVVRFVDPWERWTYAIMFVGVALTSIGSGYYHLAPDNARLLWDRLPMSVGFMGLLMAILAERIGVTTARRLLFPLLALGPISDVGWFSNSSDNILINVLSDQSATSFSYNEQG